MKKMILTVALFVATFGVANANLQKNYKVEEPKKVETVKDVLEENRTTPHIISFYDIQRIVIKNEKKYLIRIYDENWKLIKVTTGDVNLSVTPGKYYVACEKNIKPKYVSFN